MTCARISLATCAILLACAARRVKRIACVRYCFAYGSSSCVSRFIVCRVACCALSCWLCCAVLSYGDALRWLCCAVVAVRSCGYLSLLLASSAPCGAVWWRWCCRGAVLSVALLHWCWSTVCASSSARHALLLCHLSCCLHWLPPVSPTVCHPSSVRRSLVSAAPRSLCVSSDTYHYSSFHNYLMITVTYNLSDIGVYPMQ